MTKSNNGKALFMIMISPILFQISKEVFFGLVNVQRMIFYIIIVGSIIITTVLSIIIAKALQSKLSYFLPQALVLIGFGIYITNYSDNLDAWETLGLFWMIIVAAYVALFSIPTFMIFKNKIITN